MNHAIINTCSGRARSSAAERAAHNRLVAGSNPAGPTDQLTVNVLPVYR
jgi:hypothetical protein